MVLEWPSKFPVSSTFWIKFLALLLLSPISCFFFSGGGGAMLLVIILVLVLFMETRITSKLRYAWNWPTTFWGNTKWWWKTKTSSKSLNPHVALPSERSMEVKIQGTLKFEKSKINVPPTPFNIMKFHICTDFGRTRQPLSQFLEDDINITDTRLCQGSNCKIQSQLLL